MSESEISKATLSKIEHQLHQGEHQDPTGLVKEFLSATKGTLPPTKYDDIYQESTGIVKTKDGALALEITNPYNQKDVTVSIVKQDKSGDDLSRTTLDTQGNLADTFTYKGNQTDVISYQEGGKGKVASTEHLTFLKGGQTDEVFTDVKDKGKPEETITEPGGQIFMMPDRSKTFDFKTKF